MKMETLVAATGRDLLMMFRSAARLAALFGAAVHDDWRAPG